MKSDILGYLKHNLREAGFRLSQGLLPFLRWLRDRTQDAARDHAFGIFTSPRRSAQEVGIGSDEGCAYQAMSYLDLAALLSYLQLGANDSLIDFGSGMGRVVCYAATYPINRALGVELSENLCVVARQNIERLGNRIRCREANIVSADASAFVVPGDTTVFYLFNPFTGSVLAAVLHQIKNSLRLTSRRARLVFCGTVSAVAFAKVAATHDWLVPVARLTLPTGIVALIYICSQAGTTASVGRGSDRKPA